MVDTCSCGEAGNVEIVANLIAANRKKRLDPESFVDRGNDELRARGKGHLLRLQGSCPNQLADAGLNSIERAEDGLSRSHPIQCPAIIGFDRIKHGIEAILKIGNDMIVIEGHSMPRVPRSS